MSEPTAIPEWVATLVGRLALELEAARLENQALRTHLQRPPERGSSEPSG